MKNSELYLAAAKKVATKEVKGVLPNDKTYFCCHAMERVDYQNEQARNEFVELFSPEENSNQYSLAYAFGNGIGNIKPEGQAHRITALLFAAEIAKENE